MGKTNSCKWRFAHKERPRDRCELPAGKDGYCMFHSTAESGRNFVDQLVREIAKPGHWLEGARIKEDLVGVSLSRARLPSADFQGRLLRGVGLDSALLENARFQSAKLEAVTFYGSDLRGAVFNGATLRSRNGYPIDLRYAELGGISLSGSTLEGLQLEGVTFSKPTPISAFLGTPCQEMANGMWDKAARVYGQLGKRAAEDRDAFSEDQCVYASMTCWHRKAIKAGPLEDGWNPTRNWLLPTFSTNPRQYLLGLFWLLHRVVWGYGVRPARALFAMLVVFVFFGCFVFPITGVWFDATGPSTFRQLLGQSLMLSLECFVGLTFGFRRPLTLAGEIMAGVESLLGILLVALFVVSLTNKYLRRF